MNRPETEEQKIPTQVAVLKNELKSDPIIKTLFWCYEKKILFRL